MSAKKSFKNENPAMQFIGQHGVAEPIPTESPMPGPPPMKPNPLYIETKSRRLALLVQPSLHDKIKVIADRRGASVNDTIHQILQDYAGGQGAE